MAEPDYMKYAAYMGARNPIADGLAALGKTVDQDRKMRTVEGEGERRNTLVDLQIQQQQAAALEDQRMAEQAQGLRTAMQNPQTTVNPASLAQMGAYTDAALAYDKMTPEQQAFAAQAGPGSDVAKAKQQFELASAPAVPATRTESPAQAGIRYSVGQGDYATAKKLIDVDDMMNKMAAQVLESGGDPAEYHAAKSKLASAKEFAGVVKDFAKTPGLLKQMWPIISKAYPDAAGIDPESVTATKEGVAIPLMVNGQAVPNRFILYDEAGKGQLIDTTPKNDAKGFDTVDMGDKVKIVPRDGSAPTYEKKGITPGAAARITINQNKPNTDFKNETTMRKEFLNLPEVKDYPTVESSSKRAVAALNAQGKGSNVAVDQSIITVFNKMLDPTSVVRESEYARTPGDLSVLSRIKGKWDKIQNGGAGLDSKEREALARMVTTFAGIAGEQYNQQVDYYSDLAGRYGYEPKNIVRLGGKKFESGKTQQTPAPRQSGRFKVEAM